MTTFPHNFTTPLNEQSINEMNGFIQAMSSFYKFIANETEMNTEKRYIDAVKLLEAIVATTDELKPLMDDYNKVLQEQINLNPLRFKSGHTYVQ